MTSDHPHQDFMMYNLSNVYLALCDQPGTWNRHPLREQRSGSSLCSGSSAGHMCQLQDKKINNYISTIKSIRSFLQIKRFQKANHNHYSSIWSSMRWDWIYCEYCKELVLQKIKRIATCWKVFCSPMTKIVALTFPDLFYQWLSGREQK